GDVEAGGGGRSESVERGSDVVRARRHCRESELPGAIGNRFQRRAYGAVARLDAGARDDAELLIPDDTLDAPGLLLRTSHSRKAECLRGDRYQTDESIGPHTEG